MKVSWKRAFYVGGFLAGLCAVLGLAIAGGDLLTRDRIAKNKADKEMAGLRSIFGEGALIGESVTIEDADFPTLKKYWPVTMAEDSGRIYSASDTNAYGDISLLIGVYSDLSLGEIAVLENTESYAGALNDDYFEPYASAEDKDAAADNVKCGATFGAKMARNMMRSAQEHYAREVNDGE